jgi:hypothetical protein
MSRLMKFAIATIAAGIVLMVSSNASLFAAEESASELAKKTQNPVADLISVPFQNNFNFGVGPGNDLQYVLNIQPVIPVRINAEWNLITRTIAPVIHQPEMTPGAGSTTGLGDINTSLFLSPAKPGKFIWGVGPILQFPTASDDDLGTDKWCAGPAAVGLVMSGHWVVGALANNIWSYAGDDNRPDVNQFLFQYFINYNLPDGWYLTSAPIITANWEAGSGNKWTVPIGGGAGKLVRIGRLPVNFQLQAFYNLEKPDQAADWSLRFQFQFLFPK